MAKIFNFSSDQFDAVIIGDPCRPIDTELSAVLALNVTDKGFLTPRLTHDQILAINPIDGLMVYNITVGKHFYYQVDHWRAICECTSSSVIIDDNHVSLDTTFSSEKIMELLNPFNLNFFRLNGRTIFAIGEVVTNVLLEWSTNYTPDEISLNNGIGIVPNNSTTYEHVNQNIIANHTYTIIVNRNGISKTRNILIEFANIVYWGVNPNTTVTEAEVVVWDFQISNSKARTVNFNCSGGKYFYLAFPKHYGNASFTINNLTYSDVIITEQNITNHYGFSELYLIYRSGVIQFGESITVTVQ